MAEKVGAPLEPPINHAGWFHSITWLVLAPPQTRAAKINGPNRLSPFIFCRSKCVFGQSDSRRESGDDRAPFGDVVSFDFTIIPTSLISERAAGRCYSYLFTWPLVCLSALVLTRFVVRVRDDNRPQHDIRPLYSCRPMMLLIGRRIISDRETARIGLKRRPN